MELKWGRKCYSYALIKEPRNTLKITVAPDCAISVRAPLHASEADIAKRVHSRGAWIDAQIADFSLWKPRSPPRSFVSGESHKYLGRSYRLHVRSSLRNALTLTHGRLVIEATKGLAREEVKLRLDEWYNVRAKIVFPKRLDAIHQRFQDVLPDKPQLVIRRMSKRWGSYSSGKRVVLNVELIQVATGLLDYVIAHELAHAAHWSHGREWQSLMTKVMPDWRKRKAALEVALL
jgi:predicted metal-dependent hydrolase